MGLLNSVGIGLGAAANAAQPFILNMQQAEIQKLRDDRMAEIAKSTAKYASDLSFENAQKLEEAKRTRATESGAELESTARGILNTNIEQQAQAVSGTPGAEEFVRKEKGASPMQEETARRDAARKRGLLDVEKESNDRIQGMETNAYNMKKTDETLSETIRHNKETEKAQKTTAQTENMGGVEGWQFREWKKDNPGGNYTKFKEWVSDGKFNKDKAVLEFMAKLLYGNSAPTEEDVNSARVTAEKAVHGGQSATGTLPKGLVVGAPTKQPDGTYSAAGKKVTISGGKITRIE